MYTTNLTVSSTRPNFRQKTASGRTRLIEANDFILTKRNRENVYTSRSKRVDETHVTRTLRTRGISSRLLMLKRILFVHRPKNAAESDDDDDTVPI